MEEKKTKDGSETFENEILENEASEKGVVVQEPSDEGTVENQAEEPKERRGLFGAKKRERNDKMVMMLYVLAGFYLLYTAYMTVKELMDGQVEPGRDTVLNIVFAVVFVAAAIWILISSWRIHKMLKAQEEEAERKLAEEMAERGETPEPPAKGGLLGGIFIQPEQPSVASRASVFYNPADDDEESDEEAEGAVDGGEAEGAVDGDGEAAGEASGRDVDEETDSKE